MQKPAVSVVVITYNMTREIPRTILSLSPTMQVGVSHDDYEVILVDNGSTRKFDIEQCRSTRVSTSASRNSRPATPLRAARSIVGWRF